MILKLSILSIDNKDQKQFSADTKRHELSEFRLHYTNGSFSLIDKDKIITIEKELDIVVNNYQLKLEIEVPLNENKAVIDNNENLYTIDYFNLQDHVLSSISSDVGHNTSDLIFLSQDHQMNDDFAHRLIFENKPYPDSSQLINEQQQQEVQIELLNEKKETNILYDLGFE